MARKERQTRKRRPPSSREAAAPETVELEPGSAEEQESEGHEEVFPVVGIGASAGGIEAFKQMLGALPTDTGMAFVLVQHLDPTHPSMLTEILARATRMPVSEVQDRMVVEPDHVYVIPPGVTMVISRGVLQLSMPKELRGHQKGIDVFFRSLAEDHGHRAIGVILSGSSTDGTLGLQAIKAEGGITFAQDESAQHDSMPRSAVATGCVDFVLRPHEIAKEIARIGAHPYLSPASTTSRDESSPASNLGLILAVLRRSTGVDFSEYKKSTLYRRVTRRMVLQKVEGMKEYLRVLQGNPAEAEALYEDILISVTSFFRNPEAFDALKREVYPKLVENRSRLEPLRIWVLGCSTGEEAYSIAISFAEFTEASGQAAPAQIFATDLNGTGIEKARAGVYPKSIAQDLSNERLRRFFVPVDGSYRIKKEIRDMCVFARHNVLTAPPFSHMDLISCRNLLIYLEPMLQQRVVPILHYGLKPSGILWLGNSETIGSYRDLFDCQDQRFKFYSKRQGSRRAAIGLPMGDHGVEQRALERKGEEPRSNAVGGVELQKEADRILLQRYAPPAVLVNADLEILQFRGTTDPYLTPAPGKASLNLLKMLREGLLVAVRRAIQKAKKLGTAVREEGLRVKADGSFRTVHVEVLPVKGKSARENCFLVLFEDALAGAVPRAGAEELEPPREVVEDREDADRQISRLTQELSATREYLQSVIEQQEAANEELQSANEEVQSANEELQSINEELETSKEEIQSSNEELATVNDELQNRNQELNQSNNDLLNLLTGVQMAIVMLGPDLRIRRFTPAAEKMLNLIATDVGRPISDIKLNLSISDLEQLVVDVVDTVTIKELEVQDRQGRWYLLRIRPYKTLENKIDGAVLVLVDVDALKRSQETLRRQTELLDQAYEPIFIWEVGGAITYWSRGAEETYGYTKEQALGRKSFGLLAVSPPQAAILQALQQNGRWTGELNHVRRDGQPVIVESRMILVKDQDGQSLVIEACRPITERKQMEQSLLQRAEDLAAADRSRTEFLAMLAHELRNPLAPLSHALQVLKVSGSDASKLQWASEIMERQVKSMARMIDELLDVARVTRGTIQLHKKPVELAAILNRSIEDLRPAFEERGQELSVELPLVPVYLNADPVRLEQIFGNLLHNAIKFTPNDGHIWVSAELVAPPSGEKRNGAKEVVIRFRDNGAGIAQNALLHVFDLFMQSDSSPERSHGGLGIGLTLVRRLLELHDGRGSRPPAGVSALAASSSSTCRRSPRHRVPRLARGRPRLLPRERHAGYSSSTTTTTRPRAWRCSCRSKGTRCRSLWTARPPWRERASSSRRSCCWTSVCPGETATKSLETCARAPNCAMSS